MYEFNVVLAPRVDDPAGTPPAPPHLLRRLRVLLEPVEARAVRRKGRALSGKHFIPSGRLHGHDLTHRERRAPFGLVNAQAHLAESCA